VPETHVPILWAALAFAAGALFFSYPLVHTSQLTRRGDIIMLQRSKAFLWIVLGLFAVRLAARGYVEEYVSTIQTGALFFVLAFGRAPARRGPRSGRGRAGRAS
jgi:membrane protein CcdC involved in cytochrome C biogenesis